MWSQNGCMHEETRSILNEAAFIKLLMTLETNFFLTHLSKVPFIYCVKQCNEGQITEYTFNSKRNWITNYYLVKT